MLRYFHREYHEMLVDSLLTALSFAMTCELPSDDKRPAPFSKKISM